MTFVIGSVSLPSTYEPKASAVALRSQLGLGSMAVQNSSAVTITGGTINGTPLGATAASSANFTALRASSSFQASSANISKMDSTAYYTGGTSAISFTATMGTTWVLTFTNGILTGYTS